MTQPEPIRIERVYSMVIYGDPPIEIDNLDDESTGPKMTLQWDGNHFWLSPDEPES